MTDQDGGKALRFIGEMFPDSKPVVRHVFATMLTMVKAKDPAFFASQETLSEMTGWSVRSIGTALSYLESAGVIVKDGYAMAFGRPTRRWIPSADVLSDLSARAAEKRQSARAADKDSARAADKDSARPADNPSDLSRPQGREREEDSAAADAAPSAGATGSAAAPRTGSPSAEPKGIVREVMDRLGYDEPGAQRFIRDKLAAARGPVRSEIAYIRRCIEQELAAAAAPAKTASAKTASAKTASAMTKGEKRKATIAASGKRPRRGSIKAAEMAAAVARVRAGEPVEAVADDPDVWISAERLRHQVQCAIYEEARAWAEAGDHSPAELRAQFPHLAEEAEAIVQRIVDAKIRRAIEAGEPDVDIVAALDVPAELVARSRQAYERKCLLLRKKPVKPRPPAVEREAQRAKDTAAPAGGLTAAQRVAVNAAVVALAGDGEWWEFWGLDVPPDYMLRRYVEHRFARDWLRAEADPVATATEFRDTESEWLLRRLATGEWTPPPWATRPFRSVMLGGPDGVDTAWKAGEPDESIARRLGVEVFEVEGARESLLAEAVEEVNEGRTLAEVAQSFGVPEHMIAARLSSAAA